MIKIQSKNFNKTQKVTWNFSQAQNSLQFYFDNHLKNKHKYKFTFYTDYLIFLFPRAHEGQEVLVPIHGEEDADVGRVVQGWPVQGHVCDRLVVHLKGPVETDLRGEMRIVLCELCLRADRKRTLQSETE